MTLHQQVCLWLQHCWESHDTVWMTLEAMVISIWTISCIYKDVVLTVESSLLYRKDYLILIMGIPKPGKTIFVLKWDPELVKFLVTFELWYHLDSSAAITITYNALESIGHAFHWRAIYRSLLGIFLILTHWGRDKWTPFRRRHFQMHFLEWKCLNFD